MSVSPAVLSAGVYLIDKPEGVTSFAALSPVKKKVGHGKVGHAGTLDKFASGLLIVLIGPYTKLNSYLSGLDKCYTGTMRFGETSETLDPEGELHAAGPVPDYDTIIHHMSDFIGTIRQVPPKYSAVHIGGERAYKKAQKGENVEVPEREVSIYSFTPLEWEPPELRFSVTCSKGTYIRSLARDLGEVCGSGAYLTSLRRDSIGPFEAERAVSPDDFTAESHALSDREVLDAIPQLLPVRIRPDYYEHIANGKPLKLGLLEELDTGRRLQIDPRGGLVGTSDQNMEAGDQGEFHSGLVGVLDIEDRLAALCRFDGEKFSYRFVMPREQQSRIQRGSSQPQEQEQPQEKQEKVKGGRR